MKRCLLATAAILSLTFPARAGVTINFDSAGDVITGPSQAPGIWYTDRFAPAAFNSGQTGGGRTGVLQQDVSPADANGNRPNGFNSTFYNTQGRKFDLPTPTTSLQIELYVPLSWDSLVQNVAGAEGRLASFWATGFDAGNAVSKFPIIEFNNNRDGSSGNGFRVFDDNIGFVDVGGFAGYDQWYRLNMTLVGNTVLYTVNGALVYTDTDAGNSVTLGNTILQAYNAGQAYTTYWDNLLINGGATAAVPEPSTIGSLAMAAIAGLVVRARRRPA